MKVLRTRAFVSAAIAIAIVWIANRSTQAQTDPKGTAIVGAWKLNTELSDKPQQPGDNTQGNGGRRQGGGYGRRGGGGFGRGGFGGNRGGTNSASPEDRQRMRDALREIMNPPERLTIVESNSMIILTSGDGHVERLTANGKKIVDDSTKIERKTKWDGDKLVTETSGAGSPKITETYWVDPEHKQLHVGVQMERPNRSAMTINHVYDAATGN